MPDGVDPVTALVLALAVLLAPDPPPPPVAFRHASVAVTAMDPELLLALAWQESRHVGAVVSRLQCGAGCRRFASRWRHAWPRPDWRPAYFCGVTQVTARSWGVCLALMRDDRRALEVAQVELKRWRVACGRLGSGPRGDACALAGYGAGWAGARRGTSGYARKVLRRRQILASWGRAVMLVL